jgi:hypothetical protein
VAEDLSGDAVGVYPFDLTPTTITTHATLDVSGHLMTEAPVAATRIDTTGLTPPLNKAAAAGLHSIYGVVFSLKPRFLT